MNSFSLTPDAPRPVKSFASDVAIRKDADNRRWAMNAAMNTEIGRLRAMGQTAKDYDVSRETYRAAQTAVIIADFHASLDAYNQQEAEARPA